MLQLYIMRLIFFTINDNASLKPLLRVISIKPYRSNLLHCRHIVSSLVNRYSCVQLSSLAIQVGKSVNTLKYFNIWIVLHDVPYSADDTSVNVWRPSDPMMHSLICVKKVQLHVA
jgi:hypothetical protein